MKITEYLMEHNLMIPLLKTRNKVYIPLSDTTSQIKKDIIRAYNNTKFKIDRIKYKIKYG